MVQGQPKPESYSCFISNFSCTTNKSTTNFCNFYQTVDLFEPLFWILNHEDSLVKGHLIAIYEALIFTVGISYCMIYGWRMYE